MITRLGELSQPAGAAASSAEKKQIMACLVCSHSPLPVNESRSYGDLNMATKSTPDMYLFIYLHTPAEVS